MSKREMIQDGHLGGYVRGGDPATCCAHLWSWMVQEHGVRSVLDVGCGEGHSARFFQDLGCAVCGVEGCQRAIDDSVIPGQVVQHDFCHGPYDPGRRYDLVWSCEFLEHVEPQYVPNILATFAHAGRFILVTHAFPGKDRGHHHVNCQPASYWIRRIERLGFTCDVRLSRQARTVSLRDYPGVNHFARSGLVFVRTSAATILQPSPTGLAAVAGYLSATARAWRIHQVFRWSSVYRRHVRARIASRRQARLARRAAG